MKVAPIAVSLTAACLALAGCTSDSGETSTSPSPTTSASPMDTMATQAAGTIVDVAAGNPDFSTLVAAVQAADLTSTLNGEGPFTVFAPTNAAFEALPPGLVDALLKPENKEVLTQILTYHVVPGEVMSADVEPGKVKTVEGQDLTIAVEDDGTVTVNGATVEKVDIEASNGVIHVIDEVLVPPGVDVESLL